MDAKKIPSNPFLLLPSSILLIVKSGDAATLFGYLETRVIAPWAMFCLCADVTAAPFYPPSHHHHCQPSPGITNGLPTNPQSEAALASDRVRDASYKHEKMPPPVRDFIAPATHEDRFVAAQNCTEQCWSVPPPQDEATVIASAASVFLMPKCGVAVSRGCILIKLFFPVCGSSAQSYIACKSFALLLRLPPVPGRDESRFSRSFRPRAKEQHLHPSCPRPNQI